MTNDMPPVGGLTGVPKLSEPLKRGFRSGEVFHKDSGMAGMVTSVAAELRKLREPFPAHEVGQLPRQNRKTGKTIYLDYVGHAAVTNRLLQIDPFWEWEPVAWTETGVPFIDRQGPQLSLWIRLTVLGVTRLGVGTCAADAFDPEKQLIGDAIRNAAMRFGVALDLWSKQDLDAGDEPVESTPATIEEALRNDIARLVHSMDDNRRAAMARIRDEAAWPVHLADYSREELEAAETQATMLTESNDYEVAEYLTDLERDDR